MKWINSETGAVVDVESTLGGVWVPVKQEIVDEVIKPKKETKKRGSKE